ncbi:hypothetical protein SBA2_100016 [Acidobacteriia bacterium SbA2]|nr:hypothetical protein SBA2_100016 [Acidobacteriia bacterium SbA2]
MPREQRGSKGPEKHLHAVILSKANNPGSCSFNELPGSFVASGSSG